MEGSIFARIRELLMSRDRRRRLYQYVAMLGTIVALLVIHALIRRGMAMTHQTVVLDCHYSGDGAHVHNADCYDAGGNLVCPLAVKEPHTHTDECYAEEYILTCGQEEGEGHTHTDECYEVVYTLICGKEETTEEHVHGPGCFKTVEVTDKESEPGFDVLTDTETEDGSDGALADDEMPAQSFEGIVRDGDNVDMIRVTVEAPAGAFPAGTVMEVKPVDVAEVEEAVAAAIEEQTEERAARIQAVDITFYDTDGVEVEPLEKITVSLTSDLINVNESPLVLHIDEDGVGEMVSLLSDGEIERLNQEPADDMLVFEAGGEA